MALPTSIAFCLLLLLLLLCILFEIQLPISLSLVFSIAFWMLENWKLIWKLKNFFLLAEGDDMMEGKSKVDIFEFTYWNFMFTHFLFDGTFSYFINIYIYIWIFEVRIKGGKLSIQNSCIDKNSNFPFLRD